MERMLKLSDAGIKDGWIEREEKLCVISIEVVPVGGQLTRSTHACDNVKKTHQTCYTFKSK